MKFRRNFIWMILPVLLLAAASVLAAPKNGAPKTVTECGTVLTEPGNYKLNNDLLDCPGHGIKIEGSNITLNLKGYEISCPDGWYGVFIKSSSETTVKNGRVSNCDVGIALWLAEDSKVMNMSSTGNRFSGIAVWESHNNVLMHNQTQGNAIHGIESWESSGNLFKHNTTLNNGGDWFGSGIDLVSETNSRIMCNRVHGNTDGVLVGPGSNGNLLRGNFVSGNIYTGIGMMGLYWKNPEPPYDEYYDVCALDDDD